MGELPAPASYYDPKKRPRSWLGEAQTQRVDRAKRTGTTIFGSAWSPDDEGRYLVCTNRGEVVVFDCDTRDHDALFRFSPSTRTLFYVGFIRPSTSSGARPTTLLTVSGEEGVWVFDWLQLLSSHLGYAANSRPCQPLHRFVTRGEVNALDWDGGSLLFGAGRSELGDTGGACHVWNIETGQSLGALQQAPPLQGQRPPKRRMRQANVPASASHTDYLHCVRSLPGGKLLTGGNDGTMVSYGSLPVQEHLSYLLTNYCIVPGTFL
jgi:WD40 repeat protein